MEKKNTSKIQENGKAVNAWIIGILIIQLILSIFILFQLSSTSSLQNNTDNIKIENIEKKVNTIDNFFKTNVPGYDSNGAGAPTQNQGSGSDNAQKVEVSADDDPYLGSNNAKVTIIEFSDYQCPFCRKYWSESYSELKKEYIDTGKIKYVFKDYPLNFHPGAIPAAIAANCVKEQSGNEGYFKFHDIAFTEQNKLGQGTIQFSEADVKSWALQVSGVDETKFDTCYKDPKQKSEIDADFAQGSKAGVSGTPSFFINGKQLVGAQPYSVIKAEIEKALQE